MVAQPCVWIRSKKNWLSEGRPKEEEEHLLSSQLLIRRERVESAKSIIPLAMVDPKGKATENSSKKLLKRKTKAFVK